MSTILALILQIILSYLTEHGDEVIEAIREKFASTKTDPAVQVALFDLQSEPSSENLEKLELSLKEAGEDTTQ